MHKSAQSIGFVAKKTKQKNKENRTTTFFVTKCKEIKGLMSSIRFFTMLAGSLGKKLNINNLTKNHAQKTYRKTTWKHWKSTKFSQIAEKTC